MEVIGGEREACAPPNVVGRCARRGVHQPGRGSRIVAAGWRIKIDDRTNMSRRLVPAVARACGIARILRMAVQVASTQLSARVRVLRQKCRLAWLGGGRGIR